MNWKRILGWPITEVVDDHDWRLERIERVLGLEPPSVLMKREDPVPAPEAAMLDCGHVSSGRATALDGKTRCPTCHEDHQRGKP